MKVGQDILDAITGLHPDARSEIFALLKELEGSRSVANARDRFLPFVRHMWPGFIEGAHHRIIADLFDDIVAGRKKRIIINMPPRHTKSEFASIYLPAYYLGHYPDRKVIQTSHTAELAVNFGRKVRALVARDDYQQVFPGLGLSVDSKAAGRWSTSGGGEYYAIGVEGKIAGKGADLFVIDDPHSEQDAVVGESRPEVYDRVMNWYEGGPRQRLQPGAAIVIVMTRWSMRDLTAQLLKKQLQEKGADKWELVELPAILPSGSAIWPEYWKLDELLRTKASIPISKWNAQYQQHPTAEEGALIKREHWKDWEKETVPKKMEAVVQSWDTAYSTGTRADYSACTTWGIFLNEETDTLNVLLLDAQRGKWEFPELKAKATEFYKEWEPDMCLVEARAAGHPLIHELRAIGLPIQDITVARGSRMLPNDKLTRINSITDIFSSGYVWAPKGKMWAQEVIEECAAFPSGEHDDYVDTVYMALARFRFGGWIGTKLDDDIEDEDDSKSKKSVEYY